MEKDKQNVEKLKVLNSTLEKLEKTFGKVDEATPASLLNRHPDATIYCDEEAASLLKK